MKRQQAFDAYAANYDALFTHSRIGAIQRKQVWRRLRPYLKISMDILEINCGTGADALQLAKAGHRVLATDISEGMMAVGRQKRLAEPRLGLQFQSLGFHELAEKLCGQSFDLVFSNFGGLNCISPEETRQLATDLAGLLSPGGTLVLVYMGKKCWWEWVYYQLKGDRVSAGRRLRNEPAKVRMGESFLNVWYYDPKLLEKLLSPYFRRTSQHPVGLFVPPSYLEAFFARHPGRLAFLEKLDRWFSFSFFSNYADHFVISFEKCK